MWIVEHHLSSKINNKRIKQATAWIEAHKAELIAAGHPADSIDGLRRPRNGSMSLLLRGPDAAIAVVGPGKGKGKSRKGKGKGKGHQ